MPPLPRPVLAFLGCEMSELLVEKKNQIGRIILNRPEVHNAFNQELIAQITRAFQELKEERSLRVVVLGGKGKSFCAGADLNWMKKTKDFSQEENYADSFRMATMMEAIQQCPLPVVGRIQGAALGGGVGLMAACDYVLMLESAPWGLTEVNLGLIPAVISSAVIQKIGLGHARATFLSGRRYDGKQAMQMGLAHEVLGSLGELDERVEELCKQIKNTGPKASRMAKELIRIHESFAHRPQKLKDLTCQMIATQRAGREGQEGMAALLEKRRPQWECPP